MGKNHDATQSRLHSGHSHAHGHNHDNTYLTSSNKSDAGVRITRIGLFVNLGMAIGKGVGGIVFNSQALTADALHALTDLVSDITTLATISYSLRPATSRFPMGYGKIESLGGLGVSGILLSGGIMIGLQSIMTLCQQFFPEIGHILSHIGLFEHGHSHSHSTTDLGPNINAAWLAGGSIIIKEWLYRATMKVAKQKRSAILSSNAYHHRVDSLTAFVALLTILASRFIANAQWLDPVGGLAISGMIVQAGWGNTKSALYELSDVTIDDKIKGKVQTAAETALTEQFDGAAEIKGVQGVKSGQNILVEIEVSTPKDWTVDRTYEVQRVLREQVTAKTRGVRRVVVRFSPAEKDESAFEGEFVSLQTSESEPEHSDGEYKHTHANRNDHGLKQANGGGAGAGAQLNGHTHKHR